MSRYGNGTQYNLISGAADGSRVGIKGTEDLGGGFKTIFTLESRLELDTGENRNGYLAKNPDFALLKGSPLPAASTLALANALGANNAVVNSNGALFDRTAILGIMTPVGAILLGRQYTPAYEVGANADTFETGSVGTWGGITLGTSALYTPGVAIRSSNAIQYRLQMPNGIGVSVMYSPESQGSGSLGFSNRFVGANLRYQANGYNIGIGYNQEEDSSGNPSLRTAVAGGSYTNGNMKFFAGYMTMKNDNPSIGAALNPAITAALGSSGASSVPAVISTINQNARLNEKSYSLGMHYTVGSGRLMGAIARTNNALFPGSDVSLISLGYDHNLSPRTDAYLFFAHTINQESAQYALSSAGYNCGFTTRGGQDASALQLGIRHRF